MKPAFLAEFSAPRKPEVSLFPALCLLLMPLLAQAAPPEFESRLSGLETVTVSEHHSSMQGRGLKLSFKTLPADPALALFTVEEARAFVEALEAAFHAPSSRSAPPSLARLPSEVVTAGVLFGTPVNAQPSDLSRRVHAGYAELYGPSTIPLPASLENSRWFLALQLSPRYMDEGVREAALELLSSPTVAYSLALSLMLYMTAWAAPECQQSKSVTMATLA